MEYRRAMRPVVLVAAIGASAVLGGLIGGTLVRTVDRAAPIEPAPTWFCRYSGEKQTFTTCVRDVRDCDVSGPSCVLAARAWCGPRGCTLTHEACMAFGPENQPCFVTKP